MGYAVMKVYIEQDALIAKIAAGLLKVNGCAIVFRNTIYLYRINAHQLKSNRALLCHELAHVKQWQKYGSIRFPLLYLWYCIRYGYYHNPFEVEARKRESDDSLLENVIFI